mgnify:CR=1 FL=1
MIIINFQKELKILLLLEMMIESLVYIISNFKNILFYANINYFIVN